MDIVPRNLEGTAQRLETEIGEARRAMEAASDRAARFIRQRPVASLLGALAVGYVVGRIISRR